MSSSYYLVCLLEKQNTLPDAARKALQFREHVKIYSGRTAAIPLFLYSLTIPLFRYSSIPLFLDRSSTIPLFPYSPVILLFLYSLIPAFLYFSSKCELF
jgi:hypothetical protein